MWVSQLNRQTFSLTFSADQVKTKTLSFMKDNDEFARSIVVKARGTIYAPPARSCAGYVDLVVHCYDCDLMSDTVYVWTVNLL